MSLWTWDPPEGGRSVVSRVFVWSTSSRRRAAVFVLVSLVATGAIDYATGYRYAFAPFYLLPVLLAAAAGGPASGMGVAAVAAGLWTLAQQPPVGGGFHWRSLLWNVVMRFSVLGGSGWLLTVLQREALAARQDYLTGLFNRRYFMAMLAAERSRSERNGRPYAVLSIDVDRFKALNDSRGHAAGDEALRVLARVLERGARSMDVAARTGGDEFCLLLPETADVAAAEVAERIRAAAEAEFERRGWPIGLSVGVASGTGAAGGDAAQVLRRADQAMYRDKRAPPGRHFAPRR